MLLIFHYRDDTAPHLGIFAKRIQIGGEGFDIS